MGAYYNVYGGEVAASHVTKAQALKLVNVALRFRHGKVTIEKWQD